MVDMGGRHRAADGSPPGADHFGVLFVCTGNICRSPFAEVLTRHRLLDALGGPAAAEFGIGSAGVHAGAGAPMHPETRRSLAPWHLDGERFSGQCRSRPLVSAMIERADLVLGLEPAHRSAVVTLVPQALPVAFCLREFARLAAAVDRRELPPEPVTRARALVELAGRRRGTVAVDDPDPDRVPDPMGGPWAAHQRSAQLIAAAVHTIVGLVADRDHPR
jgi:protein-tyrosine phosphatase